VVGLHALRSVPAADTIPKVDTNADADADADIAAE
jgi:hypothetical protein